MKQHRWVTEEPDIPFDLPVLYENSTIIVVDKPHFLPTMPRGMWYRSTAVMRLRKLYNSDDIIPAHRLDRMTAGVIVFVRDPRYRRAYQMLFQNHEADKVYECLAPMKPAAVLSFGTLRPCCGSPGYPAQPGHDVCTGCSRRYTRHSRACPFPLLRCSRIVKDRGTLQAYEVPGTVNARTLMTLSAGQPAEAVRRGFRAYTLYPFTGKTHQLRVHMNSIGLPIMNDMWYPQVREQGYDDFSHPLQLVARQLSFTDPVTHEIRVFRSRYPLSADTLYIPE